MIRDTLLLEIRSTSIINLRMLAKIIHNSKLFKYMESFWAMLVPRLLPRPVPRLVPSLVLRLLISTKIQCVMLNIMSSTILTGLTIFSPLLRETPLQIGLPNEYMKIIIYMGDHYLSHLPTEPSLYWTLVYEVTPLEKASSKLKDWVT